jgi:hypothetical protein
MYKNDKNTKILFYEDNSSVYSYILCKPSLSIVYARILYALAIGVE